MEDLATGKLEVEGQAQGDVAQMLKFVNSSPLVNTIGGVTRPMVAKGPASLELKLALPLEGLACSHSQGPDRPGRLGPGVRSPRRCKVDEVDGRLEFTDEVAGVQGTARQFQRHADRGERADRGAGHDALAGARHHDCPGAASAGGGAADPAPARRDAYKVEVDIGRAGTRLNIESDLAGLASDLPAPMAKTADAHLPFKLSMAPLPKPAAAAAAERIEASLGERDLLRRRARSRTDARRPMQLARAALAVNRQPTLPDQGMSFQFTGQRIDLDAWRQAMVAAR